jgi:type IV pilus assembly protein PilW
VPTDDEYAPPNAVVLAKLRSTRWYLDGTTLRVRRLGAATGEAVADGVQNMAVSYLQRGATSYAATPGNDVVAVRVNMALRGQKNTGGDVKVDGSNFITRNSSNVVNLRGRTL